MISPRPEQRAAGSAREEKGDIGAEGGGDFVEFCGFQRCVVELVEGDEGGGGVRAAAAESGAGRDGFFEADRVGEGDSGGLGEGLGGFGDEVRVVGGDVRGVASEGEGAGFLKGEGVREAGELDHEGVDVMEAVLAFADDVEREVEFGGGVEGAGAHGVVSRTIMAIMRPVFPSSLR